MSVIARAAKIAGAVGASLVAAEVAARAAIRSFGGYYRYAPGMRVRFDIDREELPTLSPVARIDINADGERGGPAPRRGEDAYRALVVGGSAAECALLDQDEAWPAIVERTLSENRARLGVSRVHVGNVARAILPVREVTILLSKILPRYDRLDLVITMVGAADIVAWMERRMPRDLGDRPMAPSKIFEQHPEGPWGLAPKQTALWRLASGLRRRIFPSVIQKPGGDWMRRVRTMRMRAKTMIDETPDAAPMLDHFEEHFTKLIQTAQRRAARVVVVRQAWRNEFGPGDERMLWNFGLGRPYREEVTAYFTPRVVNELMRAVDERAVRVAERMGVEHVDLMPVLEQSSETFYDGLHFTPYGAEVVGRAVAGAILGDRASTSTSA